MAKEIYLIGVGAEGRDSLVGKTLKTIQGCNLIIGGKRVINQFDDLGVPTYAMTANLRQLVDVVNEVEAAVTEGREMKFPSERERRDDKPEQSRAPAVADSEESNEAGESGEAAPTQERSGRRRGRRRPSPRNRGRGGQGGNAEGNDQSADAPQADAGTNDAPQSSAPSNDAASNNAPQADTGGHDAPQTSVIDSGDNRSEFSVKVDAEDGTEEPGDGAETEATATAVVEQAETGVIPAPVIETEATRVAEEAAPAPETAVVDAPESPEVAEAPEATPDSAGQVAPAEVQKADEPVTRIALLVAGDPNFYGLSKFLLERFKKEEVTIIPHISAMQLAFAAIKEPMNDAAITSSAGRNVDRLIRVVRQNSKIGIFTDKRRSPRAVAKLLRKHDVSAQCYVCQDLGTDRERIIMGSLEEIENKNFSPLSIMILFKSSADETVVPEAESKPQGRGDRNDRGARKDGRGRGKESNLRDLPPPTQAPKYELVTSLGIPDEMLSVRPEKIMRSEMRVLALAKLQLKKDHRMWDVGAGCGALSVEAARVANDGEVLAIERDFAQIRNIYENIKGFGLSNVTVMEGDIEQLAAGLPEPDRIFIGGCGGHMKSIMEMCLDRLKPGGILVLNATTLNALTEVQATLKERKLRHDMVIVNISRTVERSGLEYFEGFNPVYMITTTKD